MDTFKKNTVNIFEENALETDEQELIIEEPLAIRIDGEPYSVVMRTPGKEIFHVAGFCLGEGLVDDPDDFTTIGFCSEEDINVVTATLCPERQLKVASLLKRRGFVSQTSCGICGKELIKDLYQILTPVDETMIITRENVLSCVSLLTKHQELYERTHATHAAMLCNDQCDILSVAEDVGRHNALDKVVGEAFMQGKIKEAKIAVLSSRISYELVQKAARAGLAYVIGMSRPTALAVELGKDLNMTIACVKKDRVMVFCGQKRIVQ